MEGEEKRVDEPNSFSNASIPKRILICSAGAIVNIVFALLVYFILMMSSGMYISNTIDTVVEDNNYTASQIGLLPNDEIVEINGEDISNKYDYDDAIQNITDEDIEIKIIRNEEEYTYTTALTKIPYKSTGIYIGENAEILKINEGSTSQKNGIMVGDILKSINGYEINGDSNLVIEIISSLSSEDEDLNEVIEIEIERNDEILKMNLVPDIYYSYYLGVTFKEADNTILNKIIYAGEETKIFIETIVDNLIQLFTGNVSMDSMTGPVGISKMVSDTDGIYEFVYLLALISISLGVTNLLPIPALDGGKILILIIEAIRRKPMDQKTEINIQLIGFTLLIGLSIYITYRDILRIF